MKISEPNIQVVIIFLGLALVGFSFYYVFSVSPPNKVIQTRDECIAEENLAVANRVNQLCSKRFKEKLLCYLQDSYKKCEQKFPNSSSGGNCVLSNEIMNIERDRHVRQIDLCNEIFHN